MSFSSVENNERQSCAINTPKWINETHVLSSAVKAEIIKFGYQNRTYFHKRKCVKRTSNSAVRDGCKCLGTNFMNANHNSGKSSVRVQMQLLNTANNRLCWETQIRTQTYVWLHKTRITTMIWEMAYFDISYTPWRIEIRHFKRKDMKAVGHSPNRLKKRSNYQSG